MRFGSISIISVLFLTCGCVHSEYVRVEKNTNLTFPYDVSVGDNVKLITEQAVSVEFEITGITEDALIGEDVEVAFTDIWMLQKKEVDKATSAAISMSLAFALWGLLGVVALAVAF